MEKSVRKIVCYGEVLWDLLPSVINPAGAPLNVAFHLKKLGMQSYIISSVGEDILGVNLLEIIKKWGVDYNFCKIDKRGPTGKVIAKVNYPLSTLDEGEVNYEIMEPVAWDFLYVEKEHLKMMKNTDGFVFQSLITRNEISRKTLYSLLEYSCYKIFDVNLRPPFYSENNIKLLLKSSHFIKMSISELYEIVSWFNKGKITEEEAVCFLKECFNFKEILITKGSYGASYYGSNKLYEKWGNSINGNNPIGSGDAFLAGFLAKKMNGNSNEEAIEQATLLGALVASKAGSCPYYDLP